MTHTLIIATKTKSMPITCLVVRKLEMRLINELTSPTPITAGNVPKPNASIDSALVTISPEVAAKARAV
jgi:hypothetical protein